MQYKQFGKDGPMVSRLGLGCMRLPMVGEGKEARADDEKGVAIIRRAYELGINFFDTAWGYMNRDGQRITGLGIKPFRDKVVLSSKLPPDEVQEPADFMRKLEMSLREFDTEYIDYYHMHALNAKNWSHAKKVDMHKNMLKAKEQGLIRHISFSFHDVPEVMTEIADEGIFSSVLCQYNLIDQSNEAVMQKIADRGMGVMVMGPVGGGTIADGGEALLRLYDTSAASAPELALRFVLGYDAVSLALSGMSSIEMLEENVAIVERAASVTPEERELLHSTNDKLRELSDLYCTGCNYCAVCPQDIRPSAHFKCYNNAKIWGLYEHSKKRYDRFGPENRFSGNSADACIACGACSEHCPQKIDIPTRLQEVREYFSR